MKSRDTKVRDRKKMNKVIRKAREGANESKIHYKRIDKFKNLKHTGWNV